MNLPVIVSGPILRRVDRHSVYIWIATSRRFQIGAELFHIYQEKPEHSYTYSLVSDQSETESIRFGERLYVLSDGLLKTLPEKAQWVREGE